MLRIGSAYNRFIYYYAKTDNFFYKAIIPGTKTKNLFVSLNKLF